MATDLTTLALVRSHMQIDSADTSQDTLISALITRASAAIMRYAQREFVTTTNGSTARVFRFTGGGILDLSPYDLQSVTSIVLDTNTTSTTTLTTSDYSLLPIPARDGAYNRIELRGIGAGTATGSGARQAWRQVTVTSAAWGFPAVPAEIAEACILTVAYWIRHFSTFFSASYRDDMDTSTEGRMAIPLAAKLLIDPYRKRASR